jgi:Leucine-rich repeat (LRR) protein
MGREQIVRLTLRNGYGVELRCLWEYTSLQFLDCRGMRLTKLPPLPATLHTLVCTNNQLQCLPDLPPGLKYLYCSGNNLHCLPELPPGLIGLYCINNQLTCLPDLPVELVELECDALNDGNFLAEARELSHNETNHELH